jgi:hypothetical protein
MRNAQQLRNGGVVEEVVVGKNVVQGSCRRLPVHLILIQRCRLKLLSVCFEEYPASNASLLITQSTALVSVYDKTGLLPFAKGLKELGFRLLGSGGTAKQIREAGMEIE